MNTRVPVDPELNQFLDAILKMMPAPGAPVDEKSPLLRPVLSDAEMIAGRPVVVEHRAVPGPPGAPDVMVSIVRPAAGARMAPGYFDIHGGGMMVGSRLPNIVELADLADRHGVVGVTVDCRLAPADPYPAAVEDCYAALVWMAANAEELGVDPTRIVVAGGSAGGGLAAAVCLVARDRGGPQILAQLLDCPMIDDRNVTTSSRQFDGQTVWDRAANLAGWTAYLGEARGGADVSPYAAPARATDLSNLPAAWISVGSAEVFRDEDVDYASRIWAAGGQAELHVWAGGFHGFYGLVPQSALATASRKARRSWLLRAFGIKET